MRLVQILFGAAGAACLFYYFVLSCYAGFQKGFSVIWLCAGILSIVSAVWSRQLVGFFMHLPMAARTGILAVLGVGAIVFCFVLVVLGRAALQTPEPGADYVIVLGAQVKGTRVSKSLRYRLDAAYGYLTENPETKVIVSGGQGPGEDITEAEAMKRYLVELGIGEDRIIKEDKSTSTVENIKYSKEHIQAGSSIVVVTNGFHVFRGVRIAKKQMPECSVSGLAGQSDGILFVSMYVREVLAVIKDFLFGNL